MQTNSNLSKKAGILATLIICLVSVCIIFFEKSEPISSKPTEVFVSQNSTGQIAKIFEKAKNVFYEGFAELDKFIAEVRTSM